MREACALFRNVWVGCPHGPLSARSGSQELDRRFARLLGLLVEPLPGILGFPFWSLFLGKLRGPHLQGLEALRSPGTKPKWTSPLADPCLGFLRGLGRLRRRRGLRRGRPASGIFCFFCLPFLGPILPPQFCLACPPWKQLLQNAIERCSCRLGLWQKV